MVFHDKTSGRELDIAEVRERIMSIDVASVRISVRNALAAGGFPDTIIDKMSGALSDNEIREACLLYTSPSPRDRTRSRMPSSA